MSKPIKEIITLADNPFIPLRKIVYKDGQQYFVCTREKDINKMQAVLSQENKQSKCNAVMIVPIYKQSKKVVTIKQFRASINDFTIEFPAGLIDESEDIETTLKRELFEETGLHASEISQLLKPSYLSVGLSDEKLAVYIAIIDESENVSSEYQKTDENEQIVSIDVMSIDELIDVINSNSNVCLPMSLVALYLKNSLWI